MVWIIILQGFPHHGPPDVRRVPDHPIVTTRSAQAKTFGQFVVIYYILILYVGSSIPSVNAEFGPSIDTLMQYKCSSA